MKRYNIAIVGATGLVGQTFLKVLDEYQIPIHELRLFASSKSEGKEINYQGNAYKVEVIKEGSFKGIHYALFSAGGETSKRYAKQAVQEGAIVIDNSSQWRMDDDVPLVVPEVNLEDAFGHQLIANPNCSTIQCMLPLMLLRDKYGLEKVTYHTYQAVSGAGQQGINDLERTRDGEKPQFFPYDISKTCIPEIDVALVDGYTKEEHKMMNETRKMLHEPLLSVSATCVRVPVITGHGVAITATLKDDVTLDDVKLLFNNQKGLILLDNLKQHIYPTSDIATNTDDVYVGRLRIDKTDPHTVLMYVVADNVRKGAAANAVQIMKGYMRYEENRS